MPGRPGGDFSSLSHGMRWFLQIWTIALEMALPALGGHWLDLRWGTDPWLTIGGAVLGFAVAMLHLLQLARQLQDKRGPHDRRPKSGRR